MAQLRMQLGLTSSFTSRIRQYLLLLEVGNHSQLVCELTDFLSTPELLQLLSTSRHFYGLIKIQSIEIRILRAKLHYYEKPHVQQPINLFLGSLPLQMNCDIPSVKSQKLKQEHEALKNFNKNIKFLKYLKKSGISQNKEAFQKLMNEHKQQPVQHLKTEMIEHQPKRHGKINDLSIENTIKIDRQQVGKPVTKPEFIAEKVQTHRESAKPKQPSRGSDINPLMERFKEIEYQLAKEDYEKRKFKRMLQQPLMTMQELKKLAETDPCSRQIYLRIYEQEKARIQSENVSKLKMKPLNIRPEQIQQFVPTEKVKKVMIVKQSIAERIIDNIKSVIWKQVQIVSI